MSENNSEKTPGEIATALINSGKASKDIVTAHTEFDRQPTIPTIGTYKDLEKIRSLKKKP